MIELTNITATIFLVTITNWLSTSVVGHAPDGLHTPIVRHVGIYATNLWATMVHGTNRYTVLLETHPQNPAVPGVIEIYKPAEPNSFFHGFRHPVVPIPDPLPSGPEPPLPGPLQQQLNSSRRL